MSESQDCKAKGSCQAGCKEVLQEVKSRYNPVFGQVLKKQEKLFGEVGAVGKEVQVAKQSQVQAVQDVESCFTPVFTQILENQEKLFYEVGEVGKEVQAVKQTRAQAVQDVESCFTPVFAQVLENQEKLSSEMGAVGKEVQAAKQSQARVLQNAESHFNSDFARVFNNQEKLSAEMRELRNEMHAVKRNNEILQNSSGDLTKSWEVGAIKRQVEATHASVHEFWSAMNTQSIETGQKLHSFKLELDMAVAGVASDERRLAVLLDAPPPTLQGLLAKEVQPSLT
ncbi:hypothetical protein COCOBI_17-1430 [Coccomyxa sp. Obi]|nr:hypothetical protein COCOBI_17-1430 [Coccomyxa sp. Obi]